MAFGPHQNYEDDDHVSLGPTVELNFEKEAAEQQEQSVTPSLRCYVANPGDVETKVNLDGCEAPWRPSSLEPENELLHDSPWSSRLNIINWFRRRGGDNADDSEKRSEDSRRGSRSVHFTGNDDDNAAAIAAAIANGEVPLDDPDAYLNSYAEVHGLTAADDNASKPALFASNIWGAVGVGGSGRAPTFVVPPPTSFRTATRHPSHYLEGKCDGLQNLANTRPGDFGSALPRRKSHRGHESFLRLVVAISCFGASLAFAIFFGDGKFGLVMTTVAYERKFGAGDLDSVNDAHFRRFDAEEQIFYPDWWEKEKGIPNMAQRNIELMPSLEYNSADVTEARAPGRIETPFLWLVPRSGANFIRTIMSTCLRFVEASELGSGNEQNVSTVFDLFHIGKPSFCR